MIADTYLSVSTPVQAAAAELLDARRRDPRADPRACAAQSRTLRDARRGISRRATCCAVEGGWSAVVAGAAASRRRKRWSSSCSTRTTCSCIPDTSSTSRAKPSSSSACWSSRRRSTQAVARVLIARHGGASRMMRRAERRDRAAVLAGVARSWGIGEFRRSADVRALARGSRPVVSCRSCRSTRCRRIEQSPYSAMTAMALDPIYITMPAVAGLRRPGRRAAARRAPRDALRRVARRRRASTTRPSARLKERCLRRAFDRFLQRKSARGTPRARAFEALRAPRVVVARGVRAVSGAAAQHASAPVDGVAGAARSARERRWPRSRAPGSRAESHLSHRTCSGSPPSSGGGARKRRHGRRACSAICRS